jgi:hypothetical protein
MPEPVAATALAERSQAGTGTPSGWNPRKVPAVDRIG